MNAQCDKDYIYAVVNLTTKCIEKHQLSKECIPSKEWLRLPSLIIALVIMDLRNPTTKLLDLRLT